MSIYDDVVCVQRRTMTLFFIIDASTSMEGWKMQILNDTIRGIVPQLRKLSDNNSDAEIKIAALVFSTGSDWMYGKPCSLDNFEWMDVEADGLTDLGSALMELNTRLSVKEFMDGSQGSYAPVFILLSDGMPTDNFEAGLAAIKKNKWFSKGVKVAISIGETVNTKVLAQFTGSEESVIKAIDQKDLTRWIKFLSISSSTVASRSSSIGQRSDGMENKQREFMEMLRSEKESC